MSEELLKLIRQNEKKVRARNMMVVVLLFVVAALFAVIAGLTVKAGKDKVEKLVLAKDSLQTVNKNYVQHIDREDSVRKKVGLFFKRRYLTDVSAFNQLFTDTLQRYYMQTNYPLSRMYPEDQVFWKHNPVDSFAFDKSNIAVNVLDSGNMSALIKARYCPAPDKCKDVVEELRFNSDLKIYFVRAYNVEKLAR